MSGEDDTSSSGIVRTKAIIRTHFLLAEEAIKELGDGKTHCFY